MSTTKTKKEAKLKARKTSLSKKTNEELIEIILKKDNTERKNNDKIMNLTKKVDDLNVIMEANAQNQAVLENELDETEGLLSENESKLKQKEKDIDNLKKDYTSLKNKLDSYYKDINRIKMYKIIGLSFIIVNILLVLFICMK